MTPNDRAPKLWRKVRYILAWTITLAWLIPAAILAAPFVIAFGIIALPFWAMRELEEQDRSRLKEGAT